MKTINCPTHGEIKPRIVQGISPHCGICADKYEAEAKARYEDATRRAKEKNPDWKPLSAVIRPRKAAHPSTAKVAHELNKLLSKDHENLTKKERARIEIILNGDENR